MITESKMIEFVEVEMSEGHEKYNRKTSNVEFRSESSSAIHLPTGQRAMARLGSDGFVYAQFNDQSHPHAGGWWKYPFEEWSFFQ